MPRKCLYDNAKVVTLGRDQDGQVEWNLRMLDFALRVGFEIRLCQPYRAQTKGKVESGVKYVRRNMWPSLRFTDDPDLNRQALEWCDAVSNARVHGTIYRIPWEMLAEERPIWGSFRSAPPWRLTSGRTGRWPGTGSSVGRTPATGSTGNRWEGRCRWGSDWARWRSGPAMSALRCIPGLSTGGAALHSPRSVAGTALGGWPAPAGSGGGADPRG